MRLGTTNNEERTMINENIKTNHDLIEIVVRAGRWFRADSPDRYLPVLPEQILPLQEDGKWGPVIEVVSNPDHVHVGEYCKWAFAEPVEPHQFLYAQAKVVSVYVTSHGGGGPEEGGWSWTRSDLVAVFEIPDGPYWDVCASEANDDANKWIEEHPHRNNPDFEAYATEERLVGYRQTIGGQHYA
jgi:hypothetical protein